MPLIDILHGVEFGGIGIIKSPLSLAQKFFRFPKSTDFAAVAIAIANPEAAIANGIDGGSHWGFHHASPEFDHGTDVFRTVSLFQRAQWLAVQFITLEHSEIVGRPVLQSQLALMAR